MLVYSQASTQGKQAEVTGMLGVSFGKTPSEVVLQMKQKGYLPKQSKAGYLTFSNVKFGIYSNVTVAYYFHNNKFFHGLVLLVPDKEPKVIDLYYDVVSAFTEKYGRGNQIREFRSPFKEDDGYEVTAIQGGYATYKTTWPYLGIGMASIEISDNLIIAINYYHYKMSVEAEKESKNKNMADY